MTIKVTRYKSSSEWTLSDVTVDGVLFGKGLEDEYRKDKVLHETRIPEGTYKVTLRTFGGHHEKYKKRFADIHKGMLWVMDVPKFADILIHCGNTDKDTSGCLLIGTKADEAKGILLNSEKAYRKFYTKVIQAFNTGDPVIIIYETKEPIS